MMHPSAKCCTALNSHRIERFWCLFWRFTWQRPARLRWATKFVEFLEQIPRMLRPSDNYNFEPVWEGRRNSLYCEHPNCIELIFRLSDKLKFEHVWEGRWNSLTFGKHRGSTLLFRLSDCCKFEHVWDSRWNSLYWQTTTEQPIDGASASWLA